MRRAWVILLVGLLPGLSGGSCRDRVPYPASFEGGEFNLDFPHVEGQLLVGWRQAPRSLGPGDGLWEDQRQLIASVGAVEEYRIRHRKTSVVRLGRRRDSELRRRARELARSGLVAHVVANTLVFFDQGGAGAPSDPKYAEQWALKKVDAPGAWAHTKGTRDVIVAVIDSGLETTHPDLQANVWVHPCEDLDHDGSIGPAEVNGSNDPCPGETSDHPDDFHGWNFRDGNNQISDQGAPHGTHVAGIIGAVGGNAVGVTGLSWEVRLMGVKVGDATIGQVSHAIQGIDYAVEHGADVLNLSWTTAHTPDLKAALVDAGAKGVVVVAAAGTARAGYEDLEIFEAYPASYKDLGHLVAVAATSSSDGLYVQSKYGAQTVAVGAPGVGILSTLSGDYALRSGTSMAAPHVAGVAALILAARPEAMAAEIRTCLMTGDPVASLAGKTLSGKRLNARLALEQCLPGDSGALGEPGRPMLITP